jgi:hypothetical protein
LKLDTFDFGVSSALLNLLNLVCLIASALPFLLRGRWYRLSGRIHPNLASNQPFNFSLKPCSILAPFSALNSASG